MSRALLLTVSVIFVACGGGGPVPTLPAKVVGKCTYTNQFSNKEECRDYVGDWTDAAATQDCKGQRSTIVLGEKCSVTPILGHCVLTNDKEKQLFTRIAFPGDDKAQCGSSKRGCEFFGGGVFDPQPVCGGVVVSGGETGLPTFLPPVLSCVDPKAGEPAGKSEGGKVCTWEAISGATEEGRLFSDYASCDRVRTQRPYYPVEPQEGFDQADSRMADASYVAEVDWVKSQVRSAACVCCHSTAAPKGSSAWFLEAGPNFANSFTKRGLAMGAGWIGTIGFGAFPPEQNNGFIRPTMEHPEGSALPTTDQLRMARFFENELAHRGLTRADFTEKNGAGPLDTQRLFRPSACDSGEGISSDGTVTWVGGSARYLYVLEAEAASPTVPPNLDLPAGTIWRIDVPPTMKPLEPGAVKFGVIPEGTTQRLPATATPTPLTSGKQYYLYTLVDVGVPATRCLFTAP